MSIDARRSRALFSKLESDLKKLSTEPPAKTVHRFRTGTRRLQILLSELSPKIGRSDKKLLKLLARLRRRAGKIRDLDVQSSALRSFKVPREPRRKSQLVSKLIVLREDQEKKLRKEADKATVRELSKRLRRAARHFDPQVTHDPLTAAKEMLKIVKHSEQPVTEEMLHQYRVLVKQARYAAEFALESQETREFIAELKRAQDALGDWHDWLTLRQTAAGHLGEVRESPLVAELHNVAGAKYRHAITVLSHLRNRLSPRPAQPIKPSAPLPRHAPAQIATAA